MHTISPGLVNQTVHFGAGVRHQAAAEVERLGCARALVLSTPEQAATAAELARSIGALAAGTFAGATMHTPVEVTAQAQQYAESVKADCLVAVGGGSTTGLGKALALRTQKPQIVIPTTYAGSEATPILGQTEQGLKTTLKDARVLPQVVLYDPELVVSLPVAMSATSGLNAMAHAVEALYAQDRSAATTELALDGLRNLAQSLPQVLAKPTDLTARETSLRGAWACGAVLGLVGMALHHKLCHTLGGSFDTRARPHPRHHLAARCGLQPTSRARPPGAAHHHLARRQLIDRHPSTHHPSPRPLALRPIPEFADVAAKLRTTATRP